MKNENFLRQKKTLKNDNKMLYYKLFSYRKSTIILESNELKGSSDEKLIKAEYQDVFFLKKQF